MGRNYSPDILAQLRYGSGQSLTGDTALIVLKALLESGVSYLGGYPGSPTASLYDVQADSYDDLLADPQVKHNGSFIETRSAGGEAITLVAHPVRYDGTAPPLRLAPQPLGAQSAEILTELGYSAAERARLFEAGVCVTPEGA